MKKPKRLIGLGRAYRDLKEANDKLEELATMINECEMINNISILAMADEIKRTAKLQMKIRNMLIVNESTRYSKSHIANVYGLSTTTIINIVNKSK